MWSYNWYQNRCVFKQCSKFLIEGEPTVTMEQLYSKYDLQKEVFLKIIFKSLEMEISGLSVLW